MDITKNDLSLDSVKIDYQSVLSTVRSAVGALRREIDSTLRKIDSELENFNQKTTPMLYIQAESLERLSKQFHIAAENLHTLEHGIERPRKSFVNV